MFVAYAFVKTSHDELFICYIIFAYVYNKLFTFISLHNKWIVSLGNFFVLSILCESYILQCKLGVDI
jgi:putative flippase GtrA